MKPGVLFILVILSLMCGECGAWTSSMQAWLFPGAPACNSSNEYTDGRKIDVLKPQYYDLHDNGVLELLTVQNAGCNGYSPANAASIKKYSREQYITISSAYNGMKALCSNATKLQQFTEETRNFLMQIDFTGLDLDWEEFGSWTAQDYTNFKNCINVIGNDLHAHGKKVMFDGPAIGSVREQSYYQLKYEDLNDLPLDYIAVMAYDSQDDQGAGTAVAPNAWVTDIIKWTKSKVTDLNRIVIGLPSYGYHGKTGGYSVTEDTLEQSEGFTGFATATRDPYSFEMHWDRAGISYFYQDTQGLNSKRTLIENEGILHTSVWVLGSNPWFDPPN